LVAGGARLNLMESIALYASQFYAALQ
jgi:hypothetical protein